MLSKRNKLLHNIANYPVIRYTLDLAIAINFDQKTDQSLFCKNVAKLELKTNQTNNVILISSRSLISDFNSMNFIKTADNCDCLYPNVSLIEQEIALGTGHAVQCYIKSKHYDNTQNLLILYGDTPLIQKETIDQMTQMLNKDKVDIVILAMTENILKQYGLIHEQNGLIKEIIEPQEYSDLDFCTDKNAENNDLTNSDSKNYKKNFFNSGVMLISHKCLNLIENLPGVWMKDKSQNEYRLTDLIKMAVNIGYVVKYIECSNDELLGINTRHDLAKAEDIIQKRLRNNFLTNGVTMIDQSTVYFSYDTKIDQDVTLYPSIFFGPGVSIGKESIVYSFCNIEQTIIGEHCNVGPFAALKSESCLGDKVTIGNFVEVKNSTIGEHSKAKHLSYLGDSDIGSGVNIGASVITCNYDGVNKHRTIICDRAFIGSHASLLAPVCIGEEAIVAAASVVSSDVASGALSVSRSKQKNIPRGAILYRRITKKNIKHD
jgi:bifunctional UDP-N-acetylglucosamine pyrophosphorylase/glucosamine-1-phosphate N-acetyltransferase